jgi:hypothetical protein
MLNPSTNHHGVNKSYCDSNSGKSNDPALTGIIGFLGGVIGGGLSSFLTSLAS